MSTVSSLFLSFSEEVLGSTTPVTVWQARVFFPMQACALRIYPKEAHAAADQ